MLSLIDKIKKKKNAKEQIYNTKSDSDNSNTNRSFQERKSERTRMNYDIRANIDTEIWICNR